MGAKTCKADGSNQTAAGCDHTRPADRMNGCPEVAKAPPNRADACHLAGLAHWKRGDAGQAEIHFSRAVALDPHNPNYYNTFGVYLLETGRIERAEALLMQALQLDPLSADLLCNLGRALLLRKRFEQALAPLQKALQSNPGHAVSLANMGVAYQSLGRLDQSVACYRQALRIDPHRPTWWANMGAALAGRANYTGAETCFQQSLALAPDYAPAIRGLGTAWCALGKYEAAARIIRRFLQVQPDDAEAHACLAVVYQHTACWDGLDAILPRLTRQTEDALHREEVPAEQPLFNIGRSDDRRLNLAVAQAWSRSIAQQVCRGTRPFVHPDRGCSDRRISIGYLSADFCNHAVAHQVVDLFALHDRNKFRVCGFSVGPRKQDDYRRRIAASCDHFSDLAGVDAAGAARAIYDQGVDILIDLMGHTHRNRLDICGLRPAPVQIAYLGFLASSGADFIDYLIGDQVVTPPEHAPDFSEKLIRLPNCYQIISPIPTAAQAVTRREAGLPKEAFVFCCFNQICKIEPRIFKCWLSILKAVPQAVLWLYRPNDAAVERLRAAAAQQGIRPERLIFGGKVPLDEHLNRLRLADLALDTIAYNGGATTANALMAEVPVVTILGNHFVSRMSASHLLTLGLNELVAADLPAYGRLAVELAASPQRLGAIRQALRVALRTSPLLDTPCFVRNIELAYLAAWQRHRQGLPAEALDICSDRFTDRIPEDLQIRPSDAVAPEASLADMHANDRP